MIYWYIRVSTDKQTIENQRFEIEEFVKQKSFLIDIWIEETISASKKLEERKFGKLLKKLKKDDTVIVSELSRMWRNLMQIMSILHLCMQKEVFVLTVKEWYELWDNINSKVLAFAFGLSAEIERNLISQRTKEALARKKAEWVILGRPTGRKTSLEHLKLYSKKEKIMKFLKEKKSFSGIGRILWVHRITVGKFVKRDVELFEIYKINNIIKKDLHYFKK
jgi:DNA invertase Pin-like site-specific DNA recombinase